MLHELVRKKVPDIAFDLFCVFARFEYAMKRGGFRKETSADAAWTTFVLSLPAEFYASVETIGDVKILFAAPPKSLVVTGNGGVDWETDATPPRDNLSLFNAVKRVRNNLVHGDKSYDGARDAELILAALTVLNQAYKCIESDPAFVSFIAEFSMDY